MTLRSRVPRRVSLTDIHRHRRTIGLHYRTLAVIGVLSACAALGQAALLLLVVRVATALTAGTAEIAGAVGPLAVDGLSTPRLLWLASAVLVAVFLLELTAAWVHARLYAQSQRTTQRTLLASYSTADFAAQTATSRGDTQQLLHVHAGQAAGLVNALSNGLTAAVNFGVLVVSALVLSPFAAAVVLCGLALMLGALRPLIQASKRLSEQRATAQREMASRLSERLELNREVRAFGVEPSADRPIEVQLDDVARTFEHLRLVSRMTSVSYRLGAFALIIGMLAVIDASNATSMAALTGALLMLLRSLSYGQATQSAIQAANEALPVVDQLLVELRRFEVSAPKVGTVQMADHHIESIELRGVQFDYETTRSESTVLHEVDLRIGRGDFVALVGPSGSGKSTLMSLLLGLHSPTQGQVLVNGHPQTDVDRDWWHQRVAHVAQDPKLSSGTILDALRFGRSSITDDQLRHAAARAHIADEIERWPDRWDTQVGTLGDQLSGGQRQRLAIARALAGTPDLLLLDEPTSALDARSEMLVGKTLEELRGEITVVAIAHRLETIDSADRIHRVVDGRLESTELPLSTGAHT